MDMNFTFYSPTWCSWYLAINLFQMSLKKSYPGPQGVAALDQGAGGSGGPGQVGAGRVVAKRSQPLPLSLPGVPGTSPWFESWISTLNFRGYQLQTGRAEPAEGGGGEEEGEGQGRGKKVSIPVLSSLKCSSLFLAPPNFWVFHRIRWI